MWFKKTVSHLRIWLKPSIIIEYILFIVFMFCCISNTLSCSQILKTSISFPAGHLRWVLVCWSPLISIFVIKCVLHFDMQHARYITQHSHYSVYQCIITTKFIAQLKTKNNILLQNCIDGVFGNVCFSNLLLP
jgi:hypothetical protein